MFVAYEALLWLALAVAQGTGYATPASFVIAQGYDTCVVTVDDQVGCWGYGVASSYGVLMSNLADSVEMGIPGKNDSLGGVLSMHSCMIATSGKLKCWLSSDSAQLGDSFASNHFGSELGDGASAKHVSSGVFGTLVTLTTGRIKCLGEPSPYCCFGAEERSANAGIVAGSSAWMDLGTDDDPAVAAYAGWFHACAIMSNGKVKCWGVGDYLGYEDKLDRGLRPQELGENLPAIQLGGDLHTTLLAVGRHHTCAVLNGTGVKCWGGSGDYGQLGCGDNESRGQGPDMGDRLSFVDLGDTSNRIVQIAAGEYSTCVLFDDGYIKCWGRAFEGQLGYGDQMPRGSMPWHMGNNLPYVDLGRGARATQISAGHYHTCALLADETVKCWGFNGDGQLGLGDTGNRGAEPCHMGDDLPELNLEDFGNTSQEDPEGDEDLETEPVFDDEEVEALDAYEAGASEELKARQLFWSRRRRSTRRRRGVVIIDTTLSSNSSTTSMSSSTSETTSTTTSTSPSSISSTTTSTTTISTTTSSTSSSSSTSTSTTVSTSTSSSSSSSSSSTTSTQSTASTSSSTSTTTTSGSSTSTSSSTSTTTSTTDSTGTTSTTSSTSTTTSSSSTTSGSSSTSTTTSESTGTSASSWSSSTSTSHTSTSTTSRSTSTSTSNTHSSTTSSETSISSQTSQSSASSSSSSSRSTSSTSASSTSSSSSSASTTSTTATWAVLSGEYNFAVNGVTVEEVRESCVSSVAQVTNVPEEHVHCLVELSEGTRLLLQIESGQQRRRLSSAWLVTYTVEVPEREVAVVSEVLENIETNAQNATDNFARLVASELALNSESDSSVVETSFLFIDLVHHGDEAGVAGLQNQVAAREAAALSLLLDGNTTQVVFVVDDFVAVAAAISKDELLGSDSFTVGAGAGSPFNVTIPTSIFGDLEGSGVQTDSLILAAVSPGSAVAQASSNDTRSGGQAGVVLAGLNVNLYSGQGARLHVANLTSGITLTLDIGQVDDSNGTIECAVWDDTLGEWSQRGLTTSRGPEGQLICVTTHLSFFGGILKGFLNAFRCANVGLFSKDSWEALVEDDWRGRYNSVLLFLFFGCICLMMLLALALDFKRMWKREWDDTYFLVVDDLNQEPDEDEDRWWDGMKRDNAGPCCLCLAGCAAGCAATADAWVEALGSASRDIVDSILSALVGHLGDLRELLESVWSGMTTGYSGAGLRFFVLQALTQSLNKHAQMAACARLGIATDDELDEAVHATAQLGLQFEPDPEADTESPLPASPGAAAPGMAWSKTTSQGEQDPDNSPTMSHSKMVAMSSSARHGLSRIHSRAHQEARNEKLQHLCNKKSEIVEQLGSHPTFWMIALGSVKHWLYFGPIGSIYVFSFYMPSSLRCLNTICDMLGALAVVTFFMSASGGTRSRKSPSECNDRADLWEKLGQMIAVGICSGICAAFPVALLSIFHTREFVHVDCYYGKQWKSQLRKWFVKDIVGWILGLSYASFCALYISLFFASVADADQATWFISASTDVLMDIFLVPLCLFVLPALLALLIILGLMATRRMSFSAVLKYMHDQVPEPWQLDDNESTADKENHHGQADLESRSQESGVQDGDAKPPGRSNKPRKLPPITFQAWQEADDAREARQGGRSWFSVQPS